MARGPSIGESSIFLAPRANGGSRKGRELPRDNNDERYPRPTFRSERDPTGEVHITSAYDPPSREVPVVDPLAPGEDPRPHPPVLPPRSVRANAAQHPRPLAPQRPGTHIDERRPRPEREQRGSGLGIVVLGLGAVLVVVAAVFGSRLINRADDGRTETATAGTEAASTTSVDISEDRDQAVTTVAPAEPLVPATLPDIDEPGLVLYQVSLLDAYTGTGATGSVEIYFNALNGQICHLFDVAAIEGQYRGFINEGFFPRQGPSILSLGMAEDGTSQCVSASPIEVARAMVDPARFYVAATDPDGQILLRGQLDAAITVIDNRDESTISDQVALAGAARRTSDDPGGTGLFGQDEGGAYIVVGDRTVSFQGSVADEETADRLLGAFVPLIGRGVDVANQLTIEPGAPRPSGRVVIGDTLLFPSNADEISGNPAALQTLADLLTVNSTWEAQVTGHTDNVGERIYNIDLSLRRANNLRDSLADLGVAPTRINVQGAGPDQPIADNATANGRAANRRIEITITS